MHDMQEEGQTTLSQIKPLQQSSARKKESVSASFKENISFELLPEELFPFTRENQIRNAINCLNANSPFVFFDLVLSEEEKYIFKNIKINSTEEYNNFGNLEVLEPELRQFIQSLGPQNEENAETIARIIGKVVQTIVQCSGPKTAWVVLRSFTPTPEYDIPRWHRNGSYYSSYEENSYKLSITLKGPAALFYNLPNQIKEKFFDLEKKRNGTKFL